MKFPKGWKEENGELVKDFVFSDFKTTIAFINKVAVLAEKMNHHPTIINSYNKVSFRMNTHDAGNVITDLDIKMAEEISRLFNK